MAWDYITHMSLNNRLTVLYGSSGGHHEIGNTKEMEDFARTHPVNNVTFIPVKPSFVSKDYGFSLLGIRGFYKEYRRWHEEVFHKIEKLLAESEYDIIHFLGPIGYHEPGILYNLPIPYIWGPVGGIVKVPFPLLLYGDLKYGGHEGIKIVFKALISRNRLFANHRVKKAMRRSDVVVTATTGNNRIIKQAIGKKHHSIIKYLPENCIKELSDLDYSKFDSEVIKLIFVGRLDAGKAPLIILESLNKLGDVKKQFHLDVLGDGPLMEASKEYVRKHDLDSIVSFRGVVERSQVFNLLRKSHLMVLPSLCDANTTVVWEAMAQAVPTICLDHCGMHDTIKSTSGIRIPIANYQKVIDAFASSFKRIASRPCILKEMAENLLTDRKEYTWERRMELFEDFYSLAQSQYKNRTQTN